MNQLQALMASLLLLLLATQVSVSAENAAEHTIGGGVTLTENSEATLEDPYCSLSPKPIDRTSSPELQTVGEFFANPFLGNSSVCTGTMLGLGLFSGSFYFLFSNNDPYKYASWTAFIAANVVMLFSKTSNPFIRYGILATGGIYAMFKVVQAICWRK